MKFFDKVNKIIEDNKEEIIKMIYDIEYKEAVIPVPTSTKDCVVVNVDDMTVNVKLDESINEDIEHIIFTGTKMIDTNRVKFDNADLRDIMTYNDFNEFIKLYVEDEEISIEEAVNTTELLNLELLYFFNLKNLYFKYTKKYVDEILDKVYLEYDKDYNEFFFRNKEIETRQGYVILGKSGGNSGKGGYTSKASLPITWIKEMNLFDAENKENRAIELIFDREKITIEKR